MPEPFDPIADVANTLAVDTVTIRRWIAAGILPAVRVGGTAIRIPRSAVEALTGPDYDPDEWASITDAAELYNVSEWTIRRWIQHKNVAVRKLGPRATRVSLKSLELLTEPVAVA